MIDTRGLRLAPLFRFSNNLLISYALAMEKLFELLVFFGFFQGVFLLLVLYLNPVFRRKSNHLLNFTLIVIVVGLSGRSLHLLGAFGANPRLITISEFSMFFFGPAIALFIRESLLGQPFRKIDMLHFVAPMAHIAYLVAYFILPADDVVNGRLASGELLRIVLILGTLGLLFTTIYWIWCWKLLSEFKLNLTNELSYSVKLSFIKLLLIAIGVCLIFWLSVLLFTFFESQLYSRVTYSMVWIFLTTLILLIGFYTLTQPEIFNLKMTNTKEKYVQSKLNSNDIRRIKMRLEQMMSEKKPFLNKKLLQAELAELMGVNRPELSRILNEGFGMNFFEFTNYYRIKEFIALVESNEFNNLTLMAIAEKAGFNSKSTFNKAFKSVMGTTPRHFFSK